ncbi:NAD(+) salvage pathway protein [Coniosporium tulheliwenetii]|uniref:NAD(+) salvage pathway protein n=1 Tax=Coniosporium tulheliwenetii TaxID=3383036 RepID=A0ACC2YLY3_9PEZI|nr:NAD(+) salvage pathway protein [Cladosporium sp. JES 115]
MPAENEFKPALLIVDLQEDFCPRHYFRVPPGPSPPSLFANHVPSPQNGSLAVAGGRDIAPIINSLLSLPFTLKVATKDFHPRDHISFASNHPPPHNKPFESVITIANPYNASETERTRLWPDHCVQGTPGAELIPELDIAKIQHVVEKGQDKRVEMYSAFAAPFRDPRGLAERLRESGVTHVFVVGLAMDYCVNFTAVDAAKEGFETYVVEEATRAVDPGTWDEVKVSLAGHGVKMVSVEGREVERVKGLAS